MRAHSLNKVSGISLEPLDLLFSVCKVTDYAEIDIDSPFVFTGRTELEKSLVCPTSIVPQNTTDREDGWRAFRVCGKMDFYGFFVGRDIVRDHRDSCRGWGKCICDLNI